MPGIFGRNCARGRVAPVRTAPTPPPPPLHPHIPPPPPKNTTLNPSHPSTSDIYTLSLHDGLAICPYSMTVVRGSCAEPFSEGAPSFESPGNTLSLRNGWNLWAQLRPRSSRSCQDRDVSTFGAIAPKDSRH